MSKKDENKEINPQEGRQKQKLQEMQMQREVIEFFTEHHEALKAAKKESQTDLAARVGDEAALAAKKKGMPLGGALDNLIALLDSRIADDYTFIDPYGEIVYKPRLIQRLRSGRAIFDNFIYSQQNVRIYGDMAVMTNLATVHGVLDGREVSGKYFETHTLHKKDTGWQLLASQMNLIQPSLVPFISS
jgi:hypothetical protein